MKKLILRPGIVGFALLALAGWLPAQGVDLAMGTGLMAGGSFNHVADLSWSVTPMVRRWAGINVEFVAQNSGQRFDFYPALPLRAYFWDVNADLRPFAPRAHGLPEFLLGGGAEDLSTHDQVGCFPGPPSAGCPPPPTMQAAFHAAAMYRLQLTPRFFLRFEAHDYTVRQLHSQARFVISLGLNLGHAH